MDGALGRPVPAAPYLPFYADSPTRLKPNRTPSPATFEGMGDPGVPG